MIVTYWNLNFKSHTHTLLAWGATWINCVVSIGFTLLCHLWLISRCHARHKWRVEENVWVVNLTHNIFPCRITYITSHRLTANPAWILVVILYCHHLCIQWESCCLPVCCQGRYSIHRTRWPTGQRIWCWSVHWYLYQRTFDGKIKRLFSPTIEPPRVLALRCVAGVSISMLIIRKGSSIWNRYSDIISS